MVDHDRERDTMMFPQKPLPDVERLRDFARKLDCPNIRSTFFNDQIVKKERELRKAKDKAAAKLPKGKQAYEKLLNEWRSARGELAGVLMCIWMEQMECRLGNMLGRFADSMGSIRRMATVCREFIRFFEDSALWRPLYATCECKEKFGGSAITTFRILRERMDVAWGYMEAFTVSDKVKSARVALHKLLGYWSRGIFFSSKNPELTVKQLRDEFSNELEAVKGQLCTPKSFFTLVEKRASPIADGDGTPPSFDFARDFKVDELCQIEKQYTRGVARPPLPCCKGDGALVTSGSATTSCVMTKQLCLLLLALLGDNQKNFEKIDEKMEKLQRSFLRLARTHKKGTAPGPKITPTHYNDLKRVYEYVKQGYTIYKACCIVHAENQQRPDREDHYGSAESMRSEYPKWLKKERKAGRVV